MRIVAGKSKGLGLKPVPGKKTRPTTDKVKEALFQQIGPFFDGGQVLDLYAGSGSLGIEALSRGAESAIFIDRERAAVRTIHENIRRAGVEEQTQVFMNDAKRAMKALQKRELAFQYIFLDPPYDKVNLSEMLVQLQTHQLVGEDALVICEHPRESKLPDRVNDLQLMRQQAYDSTGVSIFSE
ncbi:16S rRNA (guanine(966)-N(2))-methyltransferase RsmD [Salsuginibacillus kocurii]|uniref:16S rRNA (guanine(966)-N(2))-methyltransferase RsmD n=1 Tax=Salsuginibacillus kocurii TaxID=427078 RepID=UPI0003730CCB|nr:16S rRNA (guanine(966)-N(2))-methyltransferase RsmD [Salsuginibacillus kocurii]